jgi:hypothetical protein
MAIKYINFFQSKALQNLPKIGIFGLKTNHLATLVVEFNIVPLKFIWASVHTYRPPGCYLPMLQALPPNQSNFIDIS